MQLRFLICVPTYNHPNSVVTVISDCMEKVDFPILVIDDGSEIPVEPLYLTNHVRNERIHFIRHEKNLGKGQALRTAIDWAVAQGFTHLITIDSDGQHPAKEIAKLVKTSYQNPWALVIGDRLMQTQNVPTSSKFGKAFSNFWIKYQTDKFVGDSQSGFRIYPLFYLQSMTFFSKRYDFEIEVLTRLIWKGVEVKAVHVEVIYFPPGLRVTHFNKLKDNFRLTILNAILVAVSLLRRHDSPMKSALATAIGVFVGCIPVYGLHTVIVGLIAFVFRMNFLYMWLGTQISLPPLVPFLVIAAHYASQFYFGHPPQGIFGLSQDWIVGILLVAIAASVICGAIVYFFKRSLMQKTTDQSQKIAAKTTAGLKIRIMEWILKNAGLKSAYAMLYLIVPYFYLYSRRARVSATEYWKIVRPDLGFFARQIKILQQLFVFAQILTDRAYQRASSKNEFKTIEGPDVPHFFQTVKNCDTGQIVMLSHIGGWEIAMNYFQRKNYDRKMTAVMFGQPEAFQHSSISEDTRKLELALFNQQQGTTLRLKENLDRGEVVGIMGDRPVGRSYELISFFGHLALFDSTAIRLKLMSRAELSFVFCTKQSERDYDINCIVADTKSESFLGLSQEQKIITLLNQYVRELEKTLQKHPEQWFNFFPFWSEKLF